GVPAPAPCRRAGTAGRRGAGARAAALRRAGGGGFGRQPPGSPALAAPAAHARLGAARRRATNAPRAGAGVHRGHPRGYGGALMAYPFAPFEPHTTAAEGTRVNGGRVNGARVNGNGHHTPAVGLG